MLLSSFNSDTLLVYIDYLILSIAIIDAKNFELQTKKTVTTFHRLDLRA